MKIRIGFVANSSSTSFMIKNLSDEPKSLLDFANEVAYMVDKFNVKYGGGIMPHITLEDFLESARHYDPAPNKKKKSIMPHTKAMWTFADESNCAIGIVLDYMLRPSGRTKSFKWRVHHYNR